MRVLHSSDLHGDLELLLSYTDEFDLWIDTGNFLANSNHTNFAAVQPTAERQHQLHWCNHKGVGQRITKWLDGRPAIICPGNQDFLPLHKVISHYGANTHLIKTAGIPVENKLWAGFREIPYLDGEWEGEIHDFDNLVEDVWFSMPDVLVTHAPPTGILSGQWGIPRLATALKEQKHDIKHHFFGHNVAEGGMQTYIDGVWHYNGARHVRAHTIDF